MSRCLLGFAAALSALLVLTGPAPNGARGQTASVEITAIWARATPGGAENGAAYLTALSPNGDRLIGATTPAAARTELHEATMEGGVMRMREVPAIDLPPGQAVTLKPGGLHIMMMGLKQPLQQGQSVPLTLTFEKAGPREVSAGVGPVGASGPGTAAGGAHRPPSH